MFRAIGRYIRALGYLVTGRVDAARQELSRNPYVVQATFDRITEEKRGRIHQYKDAVGRMIAQQEKKMAKVKQLTDEVNHLEQLKEGAAAKARTVVKSLQAQGKTMAEIKANEEYLTCMTAFSDFTSTAAEKNEHIAELEGDIKDLENTIGGHKVQLQQLVRDLEKIKEESAATVADVITAKEEEEIADMISGIANDRSSQELQEMRDLRQRQKAEARISREMAGTDTKQQEAEFLEYARSNVANDEFDQLIGLADSTDKVEKAEQPNEMTDQAQSETRLPES